MLRESTIPIVERGWRHGERLAIVDQLGQYTYAELLDAAHRIAIGLLDGRPDLAEAPVGFMAPPGFEYVAIQWGIWLAGGMAVPLGTSHPASELAYVLADAGIPAVVTVAAFEEKLAPLARNQGARLHSSAALMPSEGRELPAVGKARRAMMLYTSGTTGKPKGVVSTHENISAQVTCLVEAWE